MQPIRCVLLILMMLSGVKENVNAQGFTCGPTIRFYFSHKEIVKTAGFECAIYPKYDAGIWLPSINFGYEHGKSLNCFYTESQMAHVDKSIPSGGSLGLCFTKYNEELMKVGIQSTVWAGFILLGDIRFRLDEGGFLYGGAGNFRLGAPFH